MARGAHFLSLMGTGHYQWVSVRLNYQMIGIVKTRRTVMNRGTINPCQASSAKV
jgi:hypothetical protein